MPVVGGSISDLSVVEEQQGRNRARDRALLSSMGSGAIVRVVVAALNMAYFAVSVRSLTQVQFGAMATIATFTGLMTFADFGIGGGLMTKLSVARGRNDDSEAKAVVAGAWAAMLALGLIASCAGVVLALTLPWSQVLGMPESSQWEAQAAVLVFSIFAGLAIPANIGQRILMSSQRGAIANMWLLASAVITLGTISLMSVFNAPLWCFVATLVGAPMLVATAQSIWVLCVLYPDLYPRYHLVSRSGIWSLGQVSSLFFVLNIAVTLAYQSDMLIVASTLGAASAAVFVIGLRMFGSLSGVLTGASQQMWTSMAEALSRGDLEWVRSRFTRALVGSLAISVSCCVFLVAFGRPIARAWVGDGLVPSTGLLLVFALWTVYSIAMSQVAFLLNAAQIVGPQIVMAVCMTAANVGLSLYLTHRLGLVGPLLGSICSHIIFSGFPSLIYARLVLQGRRGKIGWDR